MRVLAMLAAIAAFQAPSSTAAATPDRGGAANAVETVHLVLSHHLDVGLNEGLSFVGLCEGFATKIVQEYFDVFIPRAISLGAAINSQLDTAGDYPGDGRFAYTIHPWIASLCTDLDTFNVPVVVATRPNTIAITPFTTPGASHAIAPLSSSQTSTAWGGTSKTGVRSTRASSAARAGGRLRPSTPPSAAGTCCGPTRR